MPSSFVERLRAELIARVQGVPGATGDAMESRGRTSSEQQLPRVWVWIESDTVSGRAKPDDGVSQFTELHDVLCVLGVLAKNTAAAATMDGLVRELRHRMLPPFESNDLLLQSVEYEDEVRDFGRPFVSASLTFQITYTAPDEDIR